MCWVISKKKFQSICFYRRYWFVAWPGQLVHQRDLFTISPDTELGIGWPGDGTHT